MPHIGDTSFLSKFLLLDKLKIKIKGIPTRTI